MDPPDVSAPEPKRDYYTVTTLPHYSKRNGDHSMMSLTSEDIERLFNGSWFNDVVMDFGLTQCLRRHSLSSTSSSRVYIFSSFFYAKLKQVGPDKISRWTESIDIFDYDVIIFPINIPTHWFIVAMLNIAGSLSPSEESGLVLSLDSLNQSRTEVLRDLCQWLQMEAKRKHRNREFITPRSRMVKVPHQDNGNDCGPFSIHNVTRLLEYHGLIYLSKDKTSPMEWERIWKPDVAKFTRQILASQIRLRCNKDRGE